MSTVAERTVERVKSLYALTLERAFGESNESVVLFSSFSDFSQNRIDDILRLLEPMLLSEGAKRRVIKRVCSIIIEMLQNVNKHSAKMEGSYTGGFIVLSKSANRFSISCGNLIFMRDKNTILNRVDHLNSLSSEQLRKLYIETLCNDSFSYKGGAGLGFLTVCKKSRRPIDENLGYLIVDVQIDNKE
jgi:predicted DNA-binding antitoxin AbrB/MazE fold protein